MAHANSILEGEEATRDGGAQVRKSVWFFSDLKDENEPCTNKFCEMQIAHVLSSFSFETVNMPVGLTLIITVTTQVLSIKNVEFHLNSSHS
jgi:hypothetical protein